VNHNEYLRDETGGRRFWPVKCGNIDLDGLLRARDQLWGEARSRYLADETWWINEPSLTASAMIEQEARRIVDPWQYQIKLLIDGSSSITASEVLNQLSIPVKDQTQLHQNRAAACLKALGWTSKSMRYNGQPRHRYAPPE
jgi:predicted P-loop ATPase